MELKEDCNQDTDSFKCTLGTVVLFTAVKILCLLAHCIQHLQLDGKVPKMVILGETEDDSLIWLFTFWVLG